MFSRLRELISSHRRKLIVTGVLVGGTFVAIKYAQRKLVELQERQKRLLVEKSRRTQHFEHTEQTCNQMIIGMGTELYLAIISECSTDVILEQLRQNPANKRELWNELKTVAFTRLTTFIYASSMLVVALRVQMNLLGGYLYRDITMDREQISDELKKHYLSLIRYFIHDGSLVRLIRSKVVAVMKTIPLTQPFSLSDLEQLFWSLQMAVNGDLDNPKAKMVSYLLPPQLPEYHNGGPLLQKMFAETLDLLESDDAVTVCSNNVCSGFSLALDAIAESMGDTVSQSQQCSTKNTENGVKSSEFPPSNGVININNVQMPLAKIIPIISGLTSKGFDMTSRPQNLATSLITFFVVSEKSKVFGANVYETFSSS